MREDLAGLRVLVVEDSPVVSAFTVDVLQDLGCSVVGPASDMAVARQLAQDEEIDAAVIDIRIRGQKAFAICEILADREVPFLLTSGYADWPLPERWQDSMQLPKPFRLEDLEAALMDLMS